MPHSNVKQCDNIKNVVAGLTQDKKENWEMKKYAYLIRLTNQIKSDM